VISGSVIIGISGCEDRFSGQPTAQSTPTTTPVRETRGVDVRWSRSIGEATGRPAIRDSTVYLAGSYTSDPSKRGIYAYDLNDGDEKWKNLISSHTPNYGPIEHDETIYVDDVSSLLALDAGTGDQLWERTWDGFVFSPPVAGNGSVYMGVTSNPESTSGPAFHEDVWALDSDDGSVLWKRDIGRSGAGQGLVSQGNPPVLHNETLFAVERNNGLFALDASDGTTVWQREFEGRYESGVILESGHLFLTVGDRLYAVSPETGEVIWSAEPVKISPHGANGVVVGGTFEMFSVFDARTGERRWGAEDTGTPVTTATGVYSQIVTEVGDLETPNTTTLRKYNWDGDQQWQFSRARSGFSAPAESDGTVVVGTSYHGNGPTVFAILPS